METTTMSEKPFHSETECMRDGKPAIKITEGIAKYNQYDRTWVKQKPTISYIDVSERGFAKSMKVVVVLREDNERKLAGKILNTPTFVKINFTVKALKEDVYLKLSHGQLYIKSFKHVGSCYACGFNSNELISVAEGKTTVISREQAIVLVAEGSPFFTGLIREIDGRLCWIRKA